MLRNKPIRRSALLGAFVVLANLDPPAAQRISDYLDPRLPTS